MRLWRKFSVYQSMLTKHCPICFDALSDKTRVKVLETVRNGKEPTVGQIVKKFSLRQPTISYHLDVLKKAGLVSSKKESQKVRYSLKNNPADSSSCLSCPIVKQLC